MPKNIITLRPLKRSDAQLFFTWYNDPEVLKFVSINSPESMEKEREWINKMSKTKGSDMIFGIELVEDHRLIGSCGLHKISKKHSSAEIAIIIGDKTLWGQGFGTEAIRILIELAFRTLEIHRISASVLSFNLRSQKSLEKIGFKKEGLQREALCKQGIFYDLVLYGLINPN